MEKDFEAQHEPRLSARDWLSRARRLNEQVQSKSEQILRLRALATRVTAGLDTDPVSHTRNVAFMQDAVVRLTDAQDELAAQIVRMLKVREEISRLLSRVENPECRLLLEKRYLMNESVKEIARDLGRSERWVRGKHRTALAAVRKLLGSRAA